MSTPLLAPPSAQDVHVWQWDLDVRAGDFDRYWEMLSAQERERAGKFRFERHRRRFVAGRGELRELLSRYLALSPQAVALGYGQEGKPFCLSQPSGWTICFNLSHSENKAALAISNSSLKQRSNHLRDKALSSTKRIARASVGMVGVHLVVGPPARAWNTPPPNRALSTLRRGGPHTSP